MIFRPPDVRLSWGRKILKSIFIFYNYTTGKKRNKSCFIVNPFSPLLYFAPLTINDHFPKLIRTYLLCSGPNK